MRTVLIGQVHDSCEVDAYEDEVQDVLHQLKYIMTQAIRKYWDWIIVPLEVEATIGESNWFDMQPIVEVDGQWKKKSG